MDIKNIRQWLTLVLVAFLPFHALFVTVATKIIVGPGSAPLAYLALWKEALLGIILVLAAVEWLKKPRLKLDRIDSIILGLIGLSVVVTAMTHGDWKLYLFGFKYDFVPLVAFLVLRRVEWSSDFLDRLFKWVLVSAGVVSVYGILSMYLPMQWFVRLGYSDLHSLYNPDGPLAAYQQIGGSGIRRIQSTMSGPNQLGLWLLLPFSIVLSRRKVIGDWSLVIGAFVVFTMLMTLSRSALLAAAVLVTLVLWKQLPRKKFFQFVGVLFVASLFVAVASYFTVPEVAVRAASTAGHISRPIEAVRSIVAKPLGYGLGTAGPASNRVSDTCVHLEEGSDSTWAQDRPELCVFVGSTQVQPEDRECRCPVLPENWYLQMGVELGVVGLLLYFMLIGVVSYWLLVIGNWRSGVGLAFLGISIAALFLHAWEDAAVAYTVWLLSAITLPKQ